MKRQLLTLEFWLASWALRYSIGLTLIGQIRATAAVAIWAAIRALSQVARLWTQPDKARQAMRHSVNRFMIADPEQEGWRVVRWRGSDPCDQGFAAASAP